MLERLLIRNLGLIDHAELEFHPGFNVITGETGAGKSMILDSLSLLSGRRMERLPGPDPEGRTIIEAEFPHPAIEEDWYARWHIDPQPVLILRREFTADGRSRAFANDVPVSLQALREAAPVLFDIHSQFDSQRLSENTFRLQLLDRIAGQDEVRIEYHALYLRLRELEEQLFRRTEELGQLKEKEDYLRFRLSELEKAAPRAGEDEELEAEIARLTHAESILQYCAEALNLLEAEGQGLSALLGQFIALMRRLGQLAKEGESLLAEAEELRLRVQQLEKDLLHLRDRTELSPERLREATARLDLLHDLMKKNNASSAAQLLEKRLHLRAELETLEQNAVDLTALEDQLRQMREQLHQAARTLTDGRQKAALQLASEVHRALAELALDKAQFRVQLNPLPSPGPWGSDQAEFLFSAQPQVSLRPVQRVASGGELSRLMLALKSAMAARHLAPTLILDEIDSGISGRISGLMARFLHKLSQGAQIIAVTHLPQVAAAGARHFLVEKEVLPTGQVLSRIFVLQGQKREEALAIMLSANGVSEPSLRAARHLLESFSS
ncbi:MAG: DNA repair protein RecN [Flavobacteriales bacterium]|nr:DNA repair protein RecN [Flavobacteriales bacterium]